MKARPEIKGIVENVSSFKIAEIRYVSFYEISIVTDAIKH